MYPVDCAIHPLNNWAQLHVVRYTFDLDKPHEKSECKPLISV